MKTTSPPLQLLTCKVEIIYTVFENGLTIVLLGIIVAVKYTVRDKMMMMLLQRCFWVQTSCSWHTHCFLKSWHNMCCQKKAPAPHWVPVKAKTTLGNNSLSWHSYCGVKFWYTHFLISKRGSHTRYLSKQRRP